MISKSFPLALALTLGIAPALSAAPKKDASPTPVETPIQVVHASLRPLPFNGKVFAIDKEASTFSTENKEKKIRVYAITPETKFTKKGAPYSFENLKTGDEIRGTALPKGDGHFETVEVSVGNAEEAKPVATPQVVGPTPKPPKAIAVKTPKKSPTPTPTPVKRAEKVVD